MKGSIFLFLIFLVIAMPSFLFAESGSVLINEIAWMGTPVARIEENQWWRYEWLELYNAGETVVMLDGWTVELSREKIDFMIPLSGTVPANGYFLIGASDKIVPLRGISHGETMDLNYKNLGGKFNNSGQRVVLKNSLGEVIDEVDTQSGWPAGDNKTKQTMERRAGSDPALLWQTSAEPGGTPKAPNSSGTVKLSLIKLEAKLNQTKEETKGKTEKDLLESSSSAVADSKLNLVKDTGGLQQFQSRVPVVNPITLLAGLLALGFSGALLLVKRFLASRQSRRT